MAVSGYTSSLADVVFPRPDQVPNRDRATTTGQRCAAQNGQYSAPTYSTFGFPSAVSAGASTVRGTACTLPGPTSSSTFAGTLVTALTTAALAAAGCADVVESEPESPEPRPAAFATTSADQQQHDDADAATGEQHAAPPSGPRLRCAHL